MIEGVFGQKIGMTHVFAEDGSIVPVTVVRAGGQVVQRKTRENDGYEALQLGFGDKKESRTDKPMKGHFKKSGGKCFYRLAEFKGSSLEAYVAGNDIKCSEVFKIGDYVDVTGRSKGKGFQGSMKRHNFSGGGGSHGSMHNRAPGSIGSSSDPSRVYKGMRMAGHMGDADVTVQNLKVVGIRPDDNVMLIRGALPGHTKAYVVIKMSIKKATKKT